MKAECDQRGVCSEDYSGKSHLKSYCHPDTQLKFNTDDNPLNSDLQFQAEGNSVNREWRSYPLIRTCGNFQS
jgi:hypothetical protein